MAKEKQIFFKASFSKKEIFLKATLKDIIHSSDGLIMNFRSQRDNTLYDMHMPFTLSNKNFLEDIAKSFDANKTIKFEGTYSSCIPLGLYFAHIAEAVCGILLSGIKGFRECREGSRRTRYEGNLTINGDSYKIHSLGIFGNVAIIYQYQKN